MKRRGLFILTFGIVASLIVGRYLGSTPAMPFTLEVVCLTNPPPANSRLPLWSAYNEAGNVLGLVPASPSHVLFAVKNRTKGPLQFRLMPYELTDSLPAGESLTKGPSHFRGRNVDSSHEQWIDLAVYRGMRFGPPDCFTKRLLWPGETALIALPRPPFDCVWRALIAYDLPLTKAQRWQHFFKERLGLVEKWNILGTAQGPVYDESISGAWITNAITGSVP